MIMGPVFRGELLRTRDGADITCCGSSTAESCYFSSGADTRRGSGAPRRPRSRPWPSSPSSTFVRFAIVQLVTILLLIPPIFGGSIVNEKQRKTLHYLMASQLSGTEIILDKVLGRLPHLVVFLAMGLPIVSILGLFGGIPLDEVIIAYVGTSSTAAFVLAMTILVSTLARQVRQAILMSYLLMLIWLFVPPVIELVGPVFIPAVYDWIRPVNEWLAISTPVNFWLSSWRRRMGPSLALSTWSLRFEWMVTTQIVGAILLLLLAIRQLRPTFRRQADTPARRTWFSTRVARRRMRWLARPACGDDGVLWKERYFAPGDIFTKLVLLPAVILVTVPLALLTEVEGRMSQVFLDLWRNGWNANGNRSENFVWALQVDLGWYTAFWLLAVAGSMRVERDDRARGRHLDQPDGDPAVRVGDPAGEGSRCDLESARFWRRTGLPLGDRPDDWDGFSPRSLRFHCDRRLVDMARRCNRNPRLFDGHIHVESAELDDRGPRPVQRLPVRAHHLVPGRCLAHWKS